MYKHKKKSLTMWILKLRFMLSCATSVVNMNFILKNKKKHRTYYFVNIWKLAKSLACWTLSHAGCRV